MVIASILPQTDFGRSDHSKDALHFSFSDDPVTYFTDRNTGKIGLSVKSYFLCDFNLLVRFQVGNLAC